MKKMLLVMLFVLTGGNVWAMSGNELYELLDGSTDNKLQGMRYLQGLRDAEHLHVQIEGLLATMEKRRPDMRRFFCAPTGATLGQVSEIVMAELRNKPSERHMFAPQIAQQALRQTWPCGR